MCGIVGIAGTRDVAPIILEALRRLEYRGYDSAGIATLVDGSIDRRRAPGKLNNLAMVLVERPLGGRTGIGHTRWATHGAPTEANAHPHASASVAIVHNGIIENFRELRDELLAKGHKFESETDSEVAAHLVTQLMREGLAPDEAAKKAVARLTGAYS
ncbi:MAG TPA: glutamine--fructose-6-phosphate aminotransferase, partial [Rhizomicrobium sp.]|nr:glutamine--fructose-6-phosphate aminotransferase [Rhizomicrobium sp.]